MKSLAKYLFLTALAAFALTSCVKEFEDEVLNPKGSPVQFTLSGDSGELTGNTIAVKVTSTVEVTTDIAIKLSLDGDATVKNANMTFPDLVMTKGNKEVSGVVQFNPAGLKGSTDYDIIIKATVYGVDLAQKVKLSYTTPPDPPKPDADAFTIDGITTDWDEKEGIVTIECGAGATMNGIKSIKAHYGNKLHFLLELTDEAAAKGVDTLFFHIFFNGDNNAEGGLLHKWNSPDIDYMVEGMIMKKGKFVSYKSNYFKRDTTAADGWKWADTKVSATFDSAGEGKYYEMSMEYNKYPGRGGLAKIFTIGFDLQDSKYNVIGFLPNTAADAPCAKASLRKVHFPIPDPDGFSIDGDAADWNKTWGVQTITCPKGAELTGLKSVKMHYGNNLHFLFELDPTVLSSPDSVSLHMYFGGTANKYEHLWAENDILDMLGGVIFKDGEFTADTLRYYTWAGDVYPNPWAWNPKAGDIEVVAAIKDNVIEMSYDYSTFPGGLLPDPLTMGFEINAADWTTLGFLPQVVQEEPEEGEDPAPEVPNTKVIVSQPAPWNATPSFAYEEDNNLWHKIDDANAVRYYYYRNPGWAATPLFDKDSVACPYVSKELNTWKIELKEATTDRWQNQVFMHPYDKKNFIALDSTNVYKFSLTIGADKPFTGFFKLTGYDENSEGDKDGEGNPKKEKKYEGATVWEYGAINFTTPYAQIKLEKEFTVTKETATKNIILIFDFGTNPAETMVYIKDITLTATPKPKEE